MHEFSVSLFAEKYTLFARHFFLVIFIHLMGSYGGFLNIFTYIFEVYSK